MELYELLRKADSADVDFLGEGVRTLAQALMEVEVAAQIGAEHGQRTPGRVTHRNGYRPRDWDTRVGTVELEIPRLCQGSYFPSVLEPRRRAERALAAVVMQCHVEGVSTRRVDDVARSMGGMVAWPGTDQRLPSPVDAPTLPKGGFSIQRKTGLSPCGRRHCSRASRLTTGSRSVEVSSLQQP
jgi:hypothetical protein